MRTLLVQVKRQHGANTGAIVAGYAYLGTICTGTLVGAYEHCSAGAGTVPSCLKQL